jgi:hypothetical protein
MMAVVIDSMDYTNQHFSPRQYLAQPHHHGHHHAVVKSPVRCADSNSLGHNGVAAAEAEKLVRRMAVPASAPSGRKAAKPQRAKRVRFASSVKTHDGLSPHKRLFDEVVHDLFNRPDDRYRTIRGVVDEGDIPAMMKLKEQLQDLMERCSEGKTPVLNCGGGRNNVVDERFAPWLFKLCERIQSHAELIKQRVAETGGPVRLGASFRI